MEAAQIPEWFKAHADQLKDGMPAIPDQPPARPLAPPLNTRVRDVPAEGPEETVPISYLRELWDTVEQLGAYSYWGYWRVHSALDDSRRFYTFKWMYGPWAKHYVMYISESAVELEGLRGLLKKVRAVQNGEKRPARDSYNKG